MSKDQSKLLSAQGGHPEPSSDGERRRIAIVLLWLTPGGAERVCLRLAEAFLAEGYEVDFVLMQTRGALLSEVPRGARVISLGVSRMLRLPRPLHTYLRRERPRAVLVGMWPLTALVILVARTLRRRPRVVATEHTTLSKSSGDNGWLAAVLLRLSIRFVYPLADGVVAVSKGVASDLRELGGRRMESVRVIYNPAARGDDQVYSSDPLPPAGTEAWFAADATRIIAVGTLKPQKDFGMLIRALARLQCDRPTARLLILGEGPARSGLERLAAELGVSEGVFLPGFVRDPYPFYVAADLFVLSSRCEGFGNVIVEALENGLSVVSTDCESGPREILSGGQYGQLVDVGDVSGLADAMDAVLRSPSDPEMQRARAREFHGHAGQAYLSALDPGAEQG